MKNKDFLYDMREQVDDVYIFVNCHTMADVAKVHWSTHFVYKFLKGSAIPDVITELEMKQFTYIGGKNHEELI